MLKGSSEMGFGSVCVCVGGWGGGGGRINFPRDRPIENVKEV